MSGARDAANMTAIQFGTPEFDAFARAAAARAGNLDHLRTRTQLEAHDKWHATSTERVFLVDCSRRWGKTWDASFKTFETIMRVPRDYGRPAIVRYCAPTKLAGRQFVIPVFDEVAKLVPEDMRPRFDSRDVCWRWPNGGVCFLGSAESMADAEAQVGTSCDLAVCDEAGKYPLGILSHLIRSVYGWQFATTPNGRIFIPSTPPLTPAHDLKGLRDRCAESGAYARYTIDDCDHVSPETRAQIIKDIFDQEGGETAVQREAYCTYVTDESMAIVPEMLAARPYVELPKDGIEAPKYFDVYVAADFGFSDLTVVLFAYYDFDRALLIIVDELVFRNTSAITVGREVMKKRHALWGIQKLPRAQVADAPLQVIADMAEGTKNEMLGPCVFGAVEKTDADAALNTARRMIGERKVRIHPRCKVLLDHLSNGIWNQARSSFARSDAQNVGHFDAIDAFKYLVRHVDWRRNPGPAIPDGASIWTHHIPLSVQERAREHLQPLVRRDRRI